jgi:hypothetical protein
MEAHSIPQLSWPVLLLSTVPSNDVATLHWLKNSIVGQEWQKAKTTFLDHYSSAEEERKVTNSFMSMRLQPGASIRHFTDEFLFIASKAGLKERNSLVRDRNLEALPVELRNKLLTHAALSPDLESLVEF